jgi:N-acetylneuraminate lyase
VGGSTGEGLQLSEEQRKRLLECVAGATPPGKKIIAHVGAIDEPSAFRLAAHAAENGADAISSLPPMGAWEEVSRYYRRLAKETTLPLLVYYFPEIRPAAFPCDKHLKSLCEEDGIAGVKFTDYNLFLLEQLAESGIVVYNGRDEVLAAGLLLGAGGGIGSTYNLLPALVTGIARAAKTDNWPEARRLQRQVNRILRVMLKYPYLPALKSACRHLFGLRLGGVLSGPWFRDAAEEATFLRELDDCFGEEHRWQ